MTQQYMDITPDPSVLLALTHTPLKPLDALCELIDNGLDSFRAAKVAGAATRYPALDVTVPGDSEVRRGQGVVRVADNGVGLDRSGLENSIKAGFSGKNRYDTLGLFGMGFNIATGKLGRRTTVITAMRGDSNALRVVIDLPRVVSSRSFQVPVDVIDKPQGFDQGTIVSVDDWWPTGEANAGFVSELARITKAQLLQQLGRRYATILRRDEEPRITMRLNGQVAEGFEHCAWSPERFVERQGWGQIPARFDINETLKVQRRCVHDGAILTSEMTSCVACGSAEFRSVEERVYGWVGIQRFDDNDAFGIDLIRNGRAIRVGEKDAFFSTSGPLGNLVKEYPTDQQTGRIIGEIHLDYVPVDFQKQDFQRSTEEWQRAITFLRGGSLLPSAWPTGERNESPVSKLFQGYRKVRNYGRADMYMGKYDETAGKAVRIGRDVERDYYARFKSREPGFYDDAQWWELVTSAGVPPLKALEECPECGYQNTPGVAECDGCGKILVGRPCGACGEELPATAVHCPKCGASQVPDAKEPWKCAVCGDTCGMDLEVCRTCGSLRGAEDPMAWDVLRRDGSLLADLSFSSQRFPMADGRDSAVLDVVVRGTGPLRPTWNGPDVPMAAQRFAGKIEVFLNESHPAFTQLGVRPVDVVATEAAQYLYGLRTDLAGRPAHTVPNIAATVVARVWGETLAMSSDQLSDAIATLFFRIADRLTGNPDASDFAGELTDLEQREMADRLVSAHKLDLLPAMSQSGAYLQYCSAATIARFFAAHPLGWFGTVWDDKIPDVDILGRAAVESAHEQLLGVYSRCLDDCATYDRYRYDDKLLAARARASLAFLEAHLL